MRHIDICCDVAVKFNFRCGVVATKFRRPRSSETVYSGLYMSMHVNIASCVMLVDRVVLRWGGDRHHPPRPVRYSWDGPRETARRTAVTVIGNMSRGPVQLAVAWAGSQQSALRDNQPGGALPPLESARPPLEVVRPPLEGESLLLLPGLPGVCFVVLLPLPLSVLPLLFW